MSANGPSTAEPSSIITATEVLDPLPDAECKLAIPYIPDIKTGKVIKVYDGDTITVATRIMFDDVPSKQIYKFPVRIRGIDTPELKTNNPKQKQLAMESRNKLSLLILGKVVHLENVGTEKYGRILADVYLGDLSIADYQIKNSHAVAYGGQTKVIPDEWTQEDDA
jgi:endonuclease YncB( thermonuclease family)